jgi:hypothetical protein
LAAELEQILRLSGGTVLGRAVPKRQRSPIAPSTVLISGLVR